MADSGRIERVTPWTIYEIREANSEELEAVFGEPSCKVIPESDHYSEIERLAGELEARAEGPDLECSPGFAAGLREAASLAREKVENDGNADFSLAEIADQLDARAEKIDAVRGMVVNKAAQEEAVWLRSFASRLRASLTRGERE